VQRQTQVNITSSDHFVHAPRLDLHLNSTSISLRSWITSLAQAQPHPQSSQPLLQRGLQVLIENIVHFKAPAFLSFSKSWASYPQASRYCKDPVPLSALNLAIEFLQQQSWVRVYPGSREAKRCTRLQFSESFLIELESRGFLELPVDHAPCDEPIVLRDQNRQLIDYVDTTETLRFRENLLSINTYLNQQLVSYQGRRLKTDLTRIFKNSFAEGGRFYRAEHLRLRSSERLEIQLNQEPVIEIDFVCLHINLLYIRETGHPFVGDAYETGSQRVPRDIFKILLQIVLNCESEFSALLAINEALRSRGYFVSASEILNLFLQKHQTISKYFFSQIGVRLQFQDSLIAERILLKAVHDQVPTLPVHDSFLVPENCRDWLLQAMSDASFEVLGAALPVKIKSTSALKLSQAAQ
jgi:hypothetical protein